MTGIEIKNPMAIVYSPILLSLYEKTVSSTAATYPIKLLSDCIQPVTDLTANKYCRKKK